MPASLAVLPCLTRKSLVKSVAMYPGVQLLTVMFGNLGVLKVSCLRISKTHRPSCQLQWVAVNGRLGKPIPLHWHLTQLVIKKQNCTKKIKRQRIVREFLTRPSCPRSARQAQRRGAIQISSQLARFQRCAGTAWSTFPPPSNVNDDDDGDDDGDDGDDVDNGQFNLGTVLPSRLHLPIC